MPCLLRGWGGAGGWGGWGGEFLDVCGARFDERGPWGFGSGVAPMSAS